MNSEIKERWIAALRSGRYNQTKHRLKDNHGHCCLGVLCEVYREHKPEFTIDKNGVVLPWEVAEWAGLSSLTYKPDPQLSRSVISMNDTLGWSFNEIADAIEGIKPEFQFNTSVLV
jgi:hypothetical protein